MESGAAVYTKPPERRFANGLQLLSSISQGLGKSWAPGNDAPDPRRERQEHEFRLDPPQRLERETADLSCSRGPPTSCGN